MDATFQELWKYETSPPVINQITRIISIILERRIDKKISLLQTVRGVLSMGDDLTSLHNGKRSWPEERLANKMMRKRGGGRWGVKYEEVITLGSSWQDLLLEERRLGRMVPRRGGGGLVWAGNTGRVGLSRWLPWLESRLPRGGASRRTVNSVKHRLQPRVSARGRA